MEDKKPLGLRTGEEIHISYIDESEKVISGFAVLVELTDVFVKFRTHQNLIVIPINKLLKLKQKNEI